MPEPDARICVMFKRRNKYHCYTLNTQTQSYAEDLAIMLDIDNYWLHTWEDAIAEYGNIHVVFFSIICDNQFLFGPYKEIGDT